MATPDLERLAAVVQKRRTERKLGIEPAAKLAGMSKDTWKRVEAGLKVRDTSYTGIEQALNWAVGSCTDVLAGGDPTISEPSEQLAGAHVAQVPASVLAQAVGDAVQSAAVRTFGKAPAGQVAKLNEEVLKELRKRGIIQ
ncbi:hypothetical protein [Streptomyces sp. NPDC005167]